MSEPHTQRTGASDARIRAMLEAFAGPAGPIPSQARSRRRATRRTFMLLAAGLVALGLAVPGSLALLVSPSETPKQFFRDRTQPANAKKVIRQMLRLRGFQSGKLTAITNVVTAHTPEGELRVYALRFTHGYTGTAVISSRKGGSGDVTLGNASTAPERVCPPGWALQAGGGSSVQPGRKYSYLVGRVAGKVASVHVLYHNGTTTRSAVSNGYFLAWIKPRAAYSNVTLIAADAAGTQVGRLRVGGEGGIPHRPGVPDAQQACGA